MGPRIAISSANMHLIAPIFLLSLSFVPIILSATSNKQSQNATPSTPSISTNTHNTFQPLSSFIFDKTHHQSPSSNEHNGIVQAPQNMSENPQTLSSAMLKAYIRANNMRAYHLDLHSYREGAKYAGDPNFVQSDNEEHKQRCANHLNEYKTLLDTFYSSDPVLDGNSIETLRLVDTFGRPESGLLLGSQFWLGSYDACMDFSLKPEKQQDLGAVNEEIKAQYCLGITQFKNWNPKDSKTSLKIGLCLPETCTSSMLNENAELLSTVETMMKYQLGSNKPFNELKLRQVYCLPHETSEIRKYSLSALCFFAFIGTFVSLCLIATTIDYLNSKMPENLKPNQELRTWRTIVVESFSLSRNLKQFLTLREEPKSQEPLVDGAFDRSTFLNMQSGIKCIALFWIICAHCFLVGPIPSSNILSADKWTKTYLADVYLTAHLMVDTFFALSGLLASYLLFKNGLDNIKTKDWFTLTLHRYLRLTPIYLICYWFTKSVGFLINTGPLWDYMTAEQSPRLNCQRESWLEAIFHQSDYKSPKEHCVPFAWFTANGIKFWIATPFFLILIHKSMRKGYLATVGVIISNMILVATLAMKSNVDVKSVIEFRPESADNMLNHMGEVYTRPYSRIGAYLVGLLAGHLFYMIDTNQIEAKLSRNTKMIACAVCTATVIVLVFILKIANGIKLDDSALPWVFGISSGIIRPLWAICTCWLVFALSHGQAKWLSRFLSANVWRILVKLSFCAYLAQGEVIAQAYLSPSNPGTFTYLDMITMPISAIIMTLFVSFILVLVLEYPMIGLEELIIPKRHKSTTAINAPATKSNGLVRTEETCAKVKQT